MPFLLVSTLKALLILRRTPLGGLTGDQSRIQRVVSAAATRSHREACEPDILDGASSTDEHGTETAPGTTAWVQARPMGPTCTLHDTHFKIATRLCLMVPLCAHETRCACAPTITGALCGTSMEPVAHHALSLQSGAEQWRHDVIAETWQAICRDAGLSAHLKQKVAEFPAGEFRRISDVYCRGVSGDLPVHLDVVVTSSIHNHANEWQIANQGVAVAREERRKLREWGYDEILGYTARLVPLAFESRGRWGQSAISELERLARMKGGLLAGSHHEAANVATGSLARWRRWLSVVLQLGSAAMVLAALGQPQPVPIDADLLQGESDIHLEAGPS